MCAGVWGEGGVEEEVFDFNYFLLQWPRKGIKTQRVASIFLGP